MESKGLKVESFQEFGKIPRFNREVVVTEKIDGTNGQVFIERKFMGSALEYNGSLLNLPFTLVLDESEMDDAGLPTHEFHVWAGSRNRFLTPENDKHGFCDWVWANALELTKLGEGRHYGEWYGKGIQRGYGLDEKRFMLFNTSRWSDPEVRPKCCEVSTVLFKGPMLNLFSDISDCGCCPFSLMDQVIHDLSENGSFHVPGFDRPEGVVLYHHAANQLFKYTLGGDGHKG
jgi:hypothetical protein